MLDLHEVEPEMFEAIHEHLLTRLDPTISEAHWRRLFTYPWRPAGTPLGYALFDGDDPVGYLGLVFVPPSPGDPRSPICGLTSWIVLDEHRGSALRLVTPVLARSDWTITNLTPTEDVRRMFERFGFLELEGYRCFLPARPDRMLNPFERSRAAVVLPGGDGAPSEVERRVVEQHGPLARYVAVRGPEGSSLALYTPGRVRGLRSACLHHVTNPAAFRAGLGAVQRLFLKRHGICILEFDQRILHGALPWGTIARRRAVPRLYRSPDRRPEEITNAFSEIVLLGL